LYAFFRAVTTELRTRRHEVPGLAVAPPEWLRFHADGDLKPDDALVFSDELGNQCGRFRTTWVTAVLKAHGVKPEWRSYNWTALTPTCQQAFKGRLTSGPVLHDGVPNGPGRNVTCRCD
jgi:hypothetical protein